MIYLLIILLLSSLVIVYDIQFQKHNKDLWYIIALIILILTSGLRFRLGVDTSRYITAFYHKYPDLWNLTWDDFSYGSDPLYMLLNSIVHSFGGKFYIVQLIHATFVNVLIFKYIKKHTPYIFTTVLFYFIINYFGYNFDTMRASMSISVCLFANDYLYDKKYLKAILLYLIGVMFHFSTLFIIVISIVFRLKFNKYGYLALLSSFFLGIFLRSSLYEYRNVLQLGEIFESKVYFYLQDEGAVDNHYNIFGYIGGLIPIIYPLLSTRYTQKSNDYIKRIESCVLIGVFLWILAFYVPILKRFASFYSIYFLIYDAFMFVNIVKNNRLDIKISMVKALLIFFPLFFITIKKYIDMDMVQCFYPYSSIFDQTIDPERERVFQYYEGDKAIPNEY